MILGGPTLTIIQNDEELTKRFQDFSAKMNVVICCRVSPKQKAEVVSLVKSKFPEKTTLSIGDGANDVAMIMASDVGVGIEGHEGK